MTPLDRILDDLELTPESLQQIEQTATDAVEMDANGLYAAAGDHSFYVDIDVLALIHAYRAAIARIEELEVALAGINNSKDNNAP